MKKLSFKLLSLMLVSSTIFYSCSGNDTEETEEVTEEVTISAEEEVSYVLPSPLQIVNLFKNAGLEYVGGLTNAKENVNNYNAKTGQKINFGIYAADMAYAITNNQTQESINYLNALRQMSEKIWMTDVFNSVGVAERLEKNVGNEDSLTTIMADLQMEMDEYLDENGASYTGSVIFAGAWIESMYLALNANKNNNEKLTNRLSEQSVIVSNIIGAVKQANEEGDLDGLIANLETINNSFKAINETTGVLTTEQVEGLKTTVTEIRNNLIKG
ncbi:MAG: hypothetical protein KF732_00120 [Flavobacteriales bacterium]|nr:hypothetical protein [Flavobacteriales bacterium]MBV6483596.1 hypothetical protein [Flavobacteriales bacterium]MBX2958336.1 hypothetical protein [Flavobacteriales bacterium]HRN41777.1 hypothetical protein [Vicingus sp.]